MRQKQTGKHFYTAFNLIFDSVRDALCVYQKEELYRKLFLSVYQSVGDEMFDNDSIRKITSGNQPIHLRAVKKLCTSDGFELFRQSIEAIILPYVGTDFFALLEALLAKVNCIPPEIVCKIENSMAENTTYTESRFIAAVLLCLNHADKMKSNPNLRFFEIDFMRLGNDKAPMCYPSYMTDLPNIAVETLIGREEDIDKLWKDIIEKPNKVLLTGVGGLGKSALTDQFLRKLTETPVTESGIEKIAWIPYDNCDIRLSMKHAFRLQCDLEDVWQTIQNICEEYREHLLIVVDNIENADADEYLRKLSLLPCRILVTSRRK